MTSVTHCAVCQQQTNNPCATIADAVRVGCENVFFTQPNMDAATADQSVCRTNHPFCDGVDPPDEE